MRYSVDILKKRFLCFLVWKIYTEKGRDKERSSIPLLQQLRLARLKSRGKNSIPIFDVGGRGLSAWAISSCLAVSELSLHRVAKHELVFWYGIRVLPMETPCWDSMLASTVSNFENREICYSLYSYHIQCLCVRIQKFHSYLLNQTKWFFITIPSHHRQRVYAVFDFSWIPSRYLYNEIK